MPENISSNNIYQTQMPSLTDAADIQDALKLYHFGSTTEPASASVSAGVVKHLYDLQTLKAPIAGPTFTGTLTAPTINASTALQIGGVAITSTAAELNILDGVTSSTAELNILDGVTSSTAELNILDGVASTAAELNLVDGSSAGTIVNSKALIYGAAGQVNATTLQIAGVSVLAAATPLPGTYGGTGVNNGSKTLTLSGNTTIGSSTHTVAFVTGGNTSVTLPATGTLVNDAVTTLSSLASIGTVTTGIWNASVIAGQYGGTGVANTGKTITLGGNLTTSGANNVTFTTSGATNVTLPTTGILVASGAIVNTDINASAAIIDTKLATISTANKVSLSALDIDGGTDIGAALDDGDLLIVDDGGAGTNRKTAVSRIPTYVFTKISGDVTINSSGVATVTGASATDINIVSTDGNTSDTTMYPVLVPENATGGQATHIDGSGLAYNASTNTLTATTFSGNATSATGATNINISTTDGNTSDTTMYPVLVGAALTGNQLPHIDSSALSYNASTNALTATTFVGALTGTATQATRAALYVTTGTDTGFDYRRIFVGPTAPENATHTLQIGDVWIDT
jgi:hypothetical protein